MIVPSHCDQTNHSPGGQQQFSAELNSMEVGNLVEKYQGAVNRIAECELTISSLREQLSSKDERIAILEEKLVQMSMELAVSKAGEDEQRLANRRLSEMCHDDANENELEGNRYRPTLRRSQTAGMESQSEGRRKSIGVHRDLAHRKSDTDAEVPPANDEGHQKMPRRASEGISRFRLGRSLLRTSWADELDSSIREESSACDETKTPARDSRKQPHRRKVSRSGSFFTKQIMENLAEEEPPAPPENGEKNNAPIGFMRKKGMVSIFDNIKNESAKPDAIEAKTKEFLERDRSTGENNQTRRPERRRSSLVSIDGVVFPVSSQDALLRGCCDDEELQGPSKNEEWSDFLIGTSGN